MGNRKDPLINDEIYHIYNRGVDKRSIFSCISDLERFFQSMKEFNCLEPVGSLGKEKIDQRRGSDKKLVDFIAYALNPNHIHFMLKQLVNGGISEFMKRLGGGYTWYFNHQNKRSGALFQSSFKSKHVKTNEYLLYLSAYVNLNFKVHEFSGETAGFYRSSWGEYIDQAINPLCEKSLILEQFKNIEEYKKFAFSALEMIKENKRKNKELEDLLLE